MKELEQMFWNAPLESLKKGYQEIPAENCYICLMCGKRIEKGLIYPEENRLYEAERYTLHHIRQEHGSVFNCLLQLDKKYTGLTELQKSLLTFFHQGLSDKAIVRQMGSGTASTIRNHRFNLRERQKEAKVLLAIMEIWGEGISTIPTEKLSDLALDLTSHDTSMIITDSETEKYISAHFKEGPDGALSRFPTKMKRRIIVLRHILQRFDPEQTYSENQMNVVLGEIYPDYATLRRYLIEYGLMERTADGRAYWINTHHPNGDPMDNHQTLKQHYKQAVKPMGVYCIRNTINGKCLVSVSRDLGKAYNSHQFQLKYGVHTNKELQADWKQFGEDKFVYEILEQIPIDGKPVSDPSFELKKLENIWLKKLQPYDERGYNERKKTGLS